MARDSNPKLHLALVVGRLVAVEGASLCRRLERLVLGLGLGVAHLLDAATRSVQGRRDAADDFRKVTEIDVLEGQAALARHPW